MKPIFSNFTNIRSLVTLGCLSTMIMGSANGSTLVLTGVGSHVSGSGTADAAEVGDVNLYANIGTDDNGHSFDALLTVNAMSAGVTNLKMTKGDAFIHVNGTSDVWVDVTLSFIVSGSSTITVPRGISASLTNVNNFVAKDIDSDIGNFTDVFGLYNAPGTPTLGSKLQSGGFVGAATDPLVPTVGVDYVRSTPASTNPPDWTGIPNVDTKNPEYFATWNYSAETVSEFRFVWGFTGDQPFTVANRGMLASIDFTGNLVPEPSEALLILVGMAGTLLRRKR